MLEQWIKGRLPPAGQGHSGNRLIERETFYRFKFNTGDPKTKIYGGNNERPAGKYQREIKGVYLQSAEGCNYGLWEDKMMMGDEPEMTLAAASVDAILQADTRDARGDLKQRAMDFITMQARKIAEADEMERMLIAKTRVSFETMVKG